MYLFVNIVNNVKNSNILYIFFQEVVLPTSSFSFFSSKINPKHIYIFLTLPATLSVEELEKQLSTQLMCKLHYSSKPRRWGCCFNFSSIHKTYFKEE